MRSIWIGTQSGNWREYLREQLRRAGEPRPKIIGIDEVSVRKGQRYRIVVSDLVRCRPIWFEGPDRSQASSL